MEILDQENNTPVGGYILADKRIEFNEHRPSVNIIVRNTGDRPVQIGSHFHFFEANKALEFDRAAAFGKRLNITATTAIRFEPGDEVEVSLIAIGGKQTVYGFNNLVDGWAGESPVAAGERTEKKLAVGTALQLGYKSSNESNRNE